MYMIDRNCQLDHVGYKVLESMEKPFLPKDAMGKADSMLIEFRGMTVDKLFEFV